MSELKSANEVNEISQLIFESDLRKNVNSYTHQLAELIETNSKEGLFEVYVVFTNVSYRQSVVNVQPRTLLIYDTATHMQIQLTQTLEKILVDLDYKVKCSTEYEVNHITTRLQIYWKK